MKPALILILIFGLAAGAGWYQASKGLLEVTGAQEETVRKQLRLVFVVENNSAELIPSTEIELFSPFLNVLGQKAISFTSEPEASHQVSTSSGFVSIDLKNLSPYEKRQLVATYTVGVTPANTSLKGQSETHTSDRVREVAKKLDGKEPVKSVDSWLAQNLTPLNYNARYQSADVTLRKGKGDCTDYAVLAQALLAEKGITSILLGGFVVEADSTVAMGRKYHNWLWLPDEGYIYDPIARKIAPRKANYIAYELEPDGSKPRFSAKNSNVKVLIQ